MRKSYPKVKENGKTMVRDVDAENSRERVVNMEQGNSMTEAELECFYASMELRFATACYEAMKRKKLNDRN